MRAVRQISYALMLFTLLGSFQISNAQERASQPPAAPKSEEGTTATIIDPRSIESVLGKEVLGPTGENLGRIVDVLVDHSGHLRAAVIDFGGFLGVGSRKIAVDWAILQFEPKDGSSIVRCTLTRERLRVAPEVKAGEPVVIIGAERPSNPAAKTN